MINIESNPGPACDGLCWKQHHGDPSRYHSWRPHKSTLRGSLRVMTTMSWIDAKVTKKKPLVVNAHLHLEVYFSTLSGS